MKYAIIETGGKQYKVKEGDTLNVELIEAENNKVEFDKILALSDGSKLTVGRPYVENVKVAAELIENKKADKITILKYRRRKSSQSKRGHRQILSKVKIESIPEA
ncbi:MAG: 50S ribosomal protein L21 [Candidatus Kaelpia imicola]|nr:50S ribosomal protein L21 [Candidatus Kaelpia imicola]